MPTSTRSAPSHAAVAVTIIELFLAGLNRQRSTPSAALRHTNSCFATTKSDAPHTATVMRYGFRIDVSPTSRCHCSRPSSTDTASSRFRTPTYTVGPAGVSVTRSV